MQHSPRLASLLFTLPLALVAACNEVETGAYGQVEFVPDDCGADSCDLDDRLGVDATTDVYLNGVDDAPVDDLHLETSAPWIAEVIAENNDGFSPRATLIGNSPGFVDILAVDRRGQVVDFITIEVAAADGFITEVSGSRVDGPHYAADYNALYFLGTGENVDVDVTAMSAGGPLLGNMQYTIEIDGALAAALAPGDDFGDGHFRFAAPAGEHDLVISVPGFSRSIHFSVK